jgi:hypothetical protein
MREGSAPPELKDDECNSKDTKCDQQRNDAPVRPGLVDASPLQCQQ